MHTNKINAKIFIADVKSGMVDSALMAKHKILSQKVLNDLLSNLIAKNLVTQDEINNRSSRAIFEAREILGESEKEPQLKSKWKIEKHELPPKNSDNVANNIKYTEEGNKDKLKLLLVGFICLIVGYFAGREHIKYEIKTTMQEAAQELQQSFSSAFFGGKRDKPKKKTTEPYEPEKNKQQAFSVELLKKGFRAHDYSAGISDDSVTFEVEFENLTGKDIRAFDGRLTFTDLLENKIISANLAINDPISAYTPLKWSGQLDYNQFLDKHQRLRAADFENIKIVFEVRKILFDDGSVKEYD